VCLKAQAVKLRVSKSSTEADQDNLHDEQLYLPFP
jgi:hypothetical protein